MAYWGALAKTHCCCQGHHRSFMWDRSLSLAMISLRSSVILGVTTLPWGKAVALIPWIKSAPFPSSRGGTKYCLPLLLIQEGGFNLWESAS